MGGPRPFTTRTGSEALVLSTCYCPLNRGGSLSLLYQLLLAPFCVFLSSSKKKRDKYDGKSAMVDLKCSDHQSSLPFRAGAPLPHIKRGREEGARNITPAPPTLLSSAHAEWPETHQPAQGHTGEGGWMVVGWGGDLKQQVPLCVHTHSLHSHLVSLDAENLSQPHTKNKSFSFPL